MRHKLGSKLPMADLRSAIKEQILIDMPTEAGTGYKNDFKSDNPDKYRGTEGNHQSGSVCV